MIQKLQLKQYKIKRLLLITVLLLTMSQLGYSQTFSKKEVYPQVLPSRDGVIISNLQVRELARVIQTNEVLENEISLYKKLTNQQDTLTYYNELHIEKLDSLVSNIDKKYYIVFNEYNKITIEYMKVEKEKTKLQSENTEIKKDKKILTRKLWYHRIGIGLVTIALIVFS